MVTKQKAGGKGRKSRVKVGKVKLNKETVKDLSRSEEQKVHGGVATRITRILCPPTKTG